jgi:peroxidase
MAMKISACQGLLLMALAAAVLSTVTVSATLQYDFYSSTSCPQAEEVVRNATMKIISDNPTMGAAFVRLFFHDCFVKVIINDIDMIIFMRRPFFYLLTL